MFLFILDKPPPSIGSHLHTQPPILPAKPVKNNTGSVHNRSSVLVTLNQQQPVANTRESSFNSTNGALSLFYYLFCYKV